MEEKGTALMGIGQCGGDGRAEDSAKMAISSPLLEISINGATDVLVSITGSSDITLNEINEAMNIIYQAVDEEANVIFGATIDDNLGDEVRVTAIATGFDDSALVKREKAKNQGKRDPWKRNKEKENDSSNILNRKSKAQGLESPAYNRRGVRNIRRNPFGSNKE